MKEFEKWQARRELKGPGYLTNLGAYKAGEEAGWREALWWLDNGGFYSHDGDEIQTAIQEELKS